MPYQLNLLMVVVSTVGVRTVHRPTNTTLVCKTVSQMCKHHDKNEQFGLEMSGILHDRWQ